MGRKNLFIEPVTQSCLEEKSKHDESDRCHFHLSSGFVRWHVGQVQEHKVTVSLLTDQEMGRQISSGSGRK